MNENFNENQQLNPEEKLNADEVINENIVPDAEGTESIETTEEAKVEEVKEIVFDLKDDLSQGFHSVLYKRINSVNIRDARMQNAFSLFLKSAECGKTISVGEIIYSVEAILKGGEPDENADNLIYCIDYIPLIKHPSFPKLFKNSVAGIYSLFNIHNGMSIDLDAIGGSVSAAETKRFIVLKPKQANKIINLCTQNGIKISFVGKLLTSNKIILCRGNEIVETIDKTIISKDNLGVSVSIGNEHFSDFASGYNSVCSLMLCNCISSSNILRFALGGDINSVFARALGFFSAAMLFKAMPIRSVYSDEAFSSVAVSRPNVADGDYFYMLKVRNGSDGLPDKAHLMQLYYYLREKKAKSIIKDVLPIRENISGMLYRLGNEQLRYIPLGEIPSDSFGVIVSIGRGQSVNGIELGYFKENIKDISEED